MSKTQKKSLLVSILTAGCEIIVFGLFASILFGPLLIAARWMVGATGATANFVLNRRWAFETRDQSASQQATRYVATATLGVSLATFLWWIIVQSTGWNPRAVHVGSMMAVWLGFTYPMFKLWVFAEPDTEADA